VAVSLLPKNQAPKVTVQAPTGGERWSGQQTIRWAGTDPTSDTLSYEVFYSADSGANWLPLPRPEAPRAPSAPAKPAPAAAKPAPSVPAKSGPATPATKAPSVAEVTGILDRHPNIPTALRDAIMKRAEEVNTAQSAGDNAPVADVTPAVVDPVNVIPTGKETSRPLDTSKLKDGVYRVKVVASDRPANADDPQSATVVSEPFTVCNAAPILVIEKASVKVAPDRTVTVSGVAFHKTVSITAVQFRVDDGQWLAASSSDALFDSDLEGFTVRTAPLAAGKHTVEIKAYQAGGVTATEKVPVEVK
jgi:hypothetical protein